MRLCIGLCFHHGSEILCARIFLLGKKSKKHHFTFFCEVGGVNLWFGNFGQLWNLRTVYLQVWLSFILSFFGFFGEERATWIQSVADLWWNGCIGRDFELAELRFRCDMERDFSIEVFFRSWPKLHFQSRGRCLCRRGRKETSVEGILWFGKMGFSFLVLYKSRQQLIGYIMWL